MASYQKYLPLDLVDPNPYQTRLSENQEHIDSLARDILAHGMMQVPAGRLVEVNNEERCQLAFGHSRFAAYKLLVKLGHDEFQDFPVNIMELDNEQMAVASWSENEKRRDLNPVERAEAIRRRIDEFGWTQQELAEKLDIDRSSVSNALRLLRLPEKIQDNLRSGILTTRQAMSLLPYYELNTDEIVKIENRYNDELFDFLQLARNGELSSDAIRERLAGYMRFVHPDEPVELPELPLIAAAEAGIQVISEQGQGISDLAPSEQEEPEISDRITREQAPSEQEPLEQEEEELLLQEEPEDDDEPETVEVTDVESAAPAEPGVKIPRSTPIDRKLEPVSGPAPAPAPSMMKPAEEQMLMVTWLKRGGVSISIRKVGEIIPNMIWLGDSTLDEIVAVLKDSLGIQ